MPNAKKPKPISEPFGFVGGKMLQQILNKGADTVTEDEKDILRARITYLTKEQIEKYGLEEKKKPETPAKAEKAAAKAAKKNK